MDKIQYEFTVKSPVTWVPPTFTSPSELIHRDTPLTVMFQNFILHF